MKPLGSWSWWLKRRVPETKNRKESLPLEQATGGKLRLVIDSSPYPDGVHLTHREVELNGFPGASNNLFKFTKEVNLLTVWTFFKVSSGKTKTFVEQKGKKGFSPLFRMYINLA